MNRTAGMILLGSSLLLAACPHNQVNRLPDTSRLDRPEPIKVSGTYVHQPSGWAFPTAVNDFQRVTLVRFDTKGLNVAGGYNRFVRSCPIVVTLYVYPSPRMHLVGADPAVVKSLESEWLKRGYAQAVAEIRHVHKNAVPVSERPIEGRAWPGKRGTFNMGKTRSELWLFIVDRTWFVKYRYSYPAACAAKARAELEKFRETLRAGSDSAARAG